MLYLGRVMELGEAETVFTAPHHPYTEALLSSVPQIDGLERPRIRLEGEIPSQPTRRRAACSTPAARGSSATSASTRNRRCARSSPSHLWRCHHSIEALRELQKTAPPARTNGHAPAAVAADGPADAGEPAEEGAP